ncbi:hypothetical protein FVE85_5181 [Porphyridium purpureum]|uniref:Uncharacterized protein n=1 Tax=Porphyridium purpureum TaxID=35688 RepID=A0A5J4Z1U2_PORPP|nr:hypothetical protein FVE85_5181 [Porphyridium purpureum]|eukprot:POR5917..scf295_1
MPNEDTLKRYRAIVCEFLGMVRGEAVDVWTPEMIQGIKPEHVVDFFKTKVYGSCAPTASQRPGGRTSSLVLYRKAISHCKPSRNTEWTYIIETPAGGDVVTRYFGNPTRCPTVNDYIKKLRRLEIRKLGKESSARRPMSRAEYKRMIEILEREKEFKYSAICRLQFHLIARRDDTCRAFKCNLLQHERFKFALTMKLAWSKNVLEERDCPRQILLASEQHCVFVALALFLETNTDNTNEWLFDSSPKLLKDRLMSHLQTKVFSGLVKVGTHSVRKFALTHARENGCSRDDAKSRGRWKVSRDILNTYEDVSLPYPDARVASALSLGALLWHCFATDADFGGVSIRIKRAYAASSASCQRPVKRMKACISGHEGVVNIDDIPEDDAPTAGSARDGTRSHDVHVLASVNRLEGSIEHKIVGLQSEMRAQAAKLESSMEHLKQTATRALRMPVRRSVHIKSVGTPGILDGQTSRVDPERPAALAKNPRTIHDLWNEYMFGLVGNKPAKDFTAPERGRVKFKY